MVWMSMYGHVTLLQKIILRPSKNRCGRDEKLVINLFYVALPTAANSLKKQKSLYKVPAPNIKPPI